MRAARRVSPRRALKASSMSTEATMSAPGDAAIAVNRFGLGARPDEPLPAIGAE